MRVVLRRGLDVILDQKLPLLGAVGPSHSLNLRVATPRTTRGLAGSQSVDYFSPKGYSLVAGRAVVVPLGADPQAAASAASRAGAAAVVLYGPALPPGSFRVAEDETAPSSSSRRRRRSSCSRRSAPGSTWGSRSGRATPTRIATAARSPSFSSRGLAFDSGDQAERRRARHCARDRRARAATDGSPLYGTVNGTSGAAATVAGAAALLAQMRPSLDGPALDSLLVGYAQPGGAAATAVGARHVPARRIGRRRGGGAADDARLRDLAGARTGTRRGRSSCATSRRGGCSSRSARSPAASRRRSRSRSCRTTSRCASGARRACR